MLPPFFFTFNDEALDLVCIFEFVWLIAVVLGACM